MLPMVWTAGTITFTSTHGVSAWYVPQNFICHNHRLPLRYQVSSDTLDRISNASCLKRHRLRPMVVISVRLDTIQLKVSSEDEFTFLA